jgi:hypothetical protein
MAMRFHRTSFAPLTVAGAIILSHFTTACSPEAGSAPAPSVRGAFSAAEPPGAVVPTTGAAASVASAAVVEALGTYHFVIPADFNGGIFGVEIDNHVSFVARRGADGEVTGRYRYVQSAEGEDFIFSGPVTCFQVYDTPVLVRFEGIPAMTHNRAKWGGLIENSNDPTLPAGGYIWFQSIDNGAGAGQGYPDVSTLSGFGNEAANETFCSIPNVPNSNFGPHAVASGDIIVR